MTTFTPENPRWRVAVHEACHGIACLATGTPFYSLEVDDDKEAGRCRHAPGSGDEPFAPSDYCKKLKMVQEECNVDLPLDWAKKNIIICLAGPMGTLQLLGAFRGCGGDFADVEAYLQLASRSQERRDLIYRECKREATRIVNHVYPFLVLMVASELYFGSPLLFTEIRTLLRLCGPRGSRLLGETNSYGFAGYGAFAR